MIGRKKKRKEEGYEGYPEPLDTSELACQVRNPWKNRLTIAWIQQSRVQLRFFMLKSRYIGGTHPWFFLLHLSSHRN
jgi:hypothetical protein